MSEPRDETNGNVPTTYNILFVCTGNTCRSPMAQALAERALEERGWSNVSVVSAGVGAAEGAPAAEHAVRVAADRGLDLSPHRARSLTPELVDWADIVLTMGASHLTAVADLGGGDKVALITEFLDEAEAGEGVPDPFGAGESAYRRTFSHLEAAVQRLLDRLEPILAP